DELLALGRILQAIVVVTKNRVGIGFVRVLKRLGDEVRPDDFQPKRVPQNVRASAVGDGLVHNVPGFDLTLVVSNDGVNMFAHSLQQFVARCARAAVATKSAAEASTKSSAPELIGSLRIRV